LKVLSFELKISGIEGHKGSDSHSGRFNPGDYARAIYWTRG